MPTAAVPLELAAWCAALAPVDTVVARVVSVDAGWIARAFMIVQALFTLAAAVLVAAAVPAVWSLRKSYEKVSGLVDRLSAELAPVSTRATHVIENVEAVTTSVRAEVHRATEIVSRAEERITGTLARAEARARDLEALLDVAQTQAEHSLVAAVSTAAGVREGFAALRDSLAGPRIARRTHDAHDAHDVDTDDRADEDYAE